MALTDAHPDYAAASKRYAYVQAHYEGAPVVDDIKRYAGAYLVHHKQGESRAAYEARADLAKYKPHYALAVDSLAGQLFQKEADAQRVWQDEETVEGEAGQVRVPSRERSLGDPDDPASPAGMLSRNADGMGTDWQTMPMRAAVGLINHNRLWCMVDGIATRADGSRREAAWVLLDEPAVKDWIGDPTDPDEVVLEEKVETRGSVMEDSEVVTQYVVYDRQGWQRYDDEGNALGDSGTYAYYATARRQRRICPVRRFDLPVKRHLGYTMAQVANTILNLESTRDWRLFTACINRLKIQTNSEPDDIREGLKEGDSLIIVDSEGDADYINPSQQPAQTASETIKQELEEFYVTFFRSYANEARQATATEIRQDAQAGVGAYLVILARTLDEMESWAMRMMEQVYLPDAPQAWGQAYVSRTTDFTPSDPLAVAGSVLTTVLEREAPVGAKAMKSIVTRYLDAGRYDYDDAEVEAAVAAFSMGDTDPVDRLLSQAAANAGDGATLPAEL